MPKRRKPIVPMKYPVTVEYQYRRDLRWLNAQTRKAVKHYLHPLVPKMVAEVTDMSHPAGGHIRQDAWQDDLNRAMTKIVKDMQGPTKATIKRMTNVGPKVNEYNKEEWRKLIRSQYGVNPTNEDPGAYADLLDHWSFNNAKLIKDIPEKTLRQISQMTQDALMSGKSQDDLSSDIYDLFDDRLDVTDSRADLIARDQVAKLNGKLTSSRQQDIGVDSYVWRTVGDERVRETHAEVDGQTFAWGTPPGETDFNEPGEDYQCRCWAEPVLPEALDVSASLLDENVDPEMADA
jgi:SPP1 gp7 family putative phage head morphogenesis protein